MKKGGIDYSRFDHIDTDSDDDNDAGSGSVVASGAAAQLTPTIVSPTPPQLQTKKGKEGRFKFEHEGRTIYEWEQSLEDVNIYMEPPPGLPRHMIKIEIGHSRLMVGVLNTPPFIDEETGGPVKVAESTWTLADGEININLQKMNKAEMWECALKGRGGTAVDAFTREEIRRKLMLERFQEEVNSFKFAVPSQLLTILCSIRHLTFRVRNLMVRSLKHGHLWVG
jgi:hypothetical protein